MRAWYQTVVTHFVSRVEHGSDLSFSPARGIFQHNARVAEWQTRQT